MLLAGCTHQLQFRAVNASSGAALSEVTVKIEERGATSYFNRERHIREAGTTDTNGLVVLNGITGKHLIYFQASGYRPALAALDETDRVKISWFLADNPFAGSPPYGPWTSSGSIATNLKEIIIIPLKPATKSE